MKKAVTLVISGLLSLSIVGCSKSKEATNMDANITPTKALTVTPMPTLTPTVAIMVTPMPTLASTLASTLEPDPMGKVVAITDDVYEEDFFTDDKILYNSISTTVPILVGDTEAIVKINDDIMKMKEEYIEYAKKVNEFILENPTYVKDEYFFQYSFSIDYSIAYNQKGLLNFLFDRYDANTGGAHGNQEKISVIYDMSKGVKLALTDFVSVDETTFHDRVYQEFVNLYNENSDVFFDDSLTSIDENISLNMCFYLGEEGVSLYFDVEEVGPYIMGFTEVTIPWSDPIFKDFN